MDWVKLLPFECLVSGALRLRPGRQSRCFEDTDADDRCGLSLLLRVFSASCSTSALNTTLFNALPFLRVCAA